MIKENKKYSTSFSKSKKKYNGERRKFFVWTKR